MTKWILVFLLFSSSAWAGSITVTIPDAKDAKVLAARDLYNTRTEQDLTVNQFVKELIRQGVVRELAIARREQAKVVYDAANAAKDSAIAQEAESVESDIQAEQTGWE